MKVGFEIIRCGANSVACGIRKRVSGPLAMVLGGVSGMIATTVVHPLDLIKVRLQLLPRSCTTIEMARQIMRCRGYAALYDGLSAGLMRQITYTTTRLGVYHALYNIYHRENKKHPTLSDKLLIGVTAGLAGALAGCPSEVALVRLMADGPLEPCVSCTCRREYKGAFHALYKIGAEEGIRALWRGGLLTMSRSVLVSGAQISSYAQVRDTCHTNKWARGMTLHIYASFVSSFLTALVSLPIDLVKTRYQVKKRGVKQAEIFEDILHKKGIKYFWKGFVPYYIRMAIHTIVALLVFDELHQYRERLYQDTKK